MNLCQCTSLSLYYALYFLYVICSTNAINGETINSDHTNSKHTLLEELDEYPDLTQDLSNDELKAALNELSLDDLNKLNNYLDEELLMEETDKDARKSKQRSVKAQKHLDNLGNWDSFDNGYHRKPVKLRNKASYNDACTDDNNMNKERNDPCKKTMHTKCTKKPKYSNSARYSTESYPKQLPTELMDDDFDAGKCTNKPMSGCRTVCDDEINTKKPKTSKPKSNEECDPDDELCLQMIRDKMAPKEPVDDDLFGTITGNTDAHAINPHKKVIDMPSVNQKDSNWWNGIENNLNYDEFKAPKADVEEPVNDYQVNKNIDSTYDGLEQDKIADKKVLANAEPQEEAKGDKTSDAKLDAMADSPNSNMERVAASNLKNNSPMSYERHKLSRVAHNHQRQMDPKLKGHIKDKYAPHRSRLKNIVKSERYIKKLAPKRQWIGFDQKQKKRQANDMEMDDVKSDVDVKANAEREQQAQEAAEANDGDSFIRSNARDPLRYLIQTEDGCIKSENESSDRKLRLDESQSEMLNFDCLNRLCSMAHKTTLNEYDEEKRTKRDEKKTNDAPEDSKETYLEKLMDSFPRDQGSHSNMNVELLEAQKSHVRVKRS